jgi:hypothetical protein
MPQRTLSDGDITTDTGCAIARKRRRLATWAGAEEASGMGRGWSGVHQIESGAKLSRESVVDNIDPISRQKLPEFAEKPSAS